MWQKFLAWMKQLRMRFFPSNLIEIRAQLFLRVWRASTGMWEDLGLVADRCVTTAAVNYIVDSFQNSATSPLSDFKYHDSGQGTGNEDVSDTTLGSPCGEARDSGTQVEGASANIYKTVATHTYAGPFTITEHGVFSAAASGTLLDRSKFTGVAVVATDKIEFTYQLTVTAGG